MAVLTGSIDVLLVDKSRLEDKTRKNGTAAKFLKIAIIETPNSQFGHTHMVVEERTKEERDAGTQTNIIGNLYTSGAEDEQGNAQPQPPEQTRQPAAAPAPAIDPNDDVPF